MRLFSRFFLNRRSEKDYRFDLMISYVLYKLIDFSLAKEEYSVQCINTKTVFKQTISDLISDSDILYGLHPIQACYIGLEAGKKVGGIRVFHESKNNAQNYLISRYGTYEICYQMRNSEICFIDKKTKNEHIMDPRDICLSEDILSEFDASHAFLIGLCAAVKRDCVTRHTLVKKRPHLRIVKSE